MSTSSTTQQKPSKWGRVGRSVGYVSVLAVIALLFWRAPELLDGINPARLTKDDGPKAADISGLRTALVAAVVGFVGIATYFTNRTKDRAQFDLAQRQFTHAQDAQEKNHEKAQEQFELAQEQFKLAQESQRLNQQKAQEQFELAQEQFKLAQESQRLNQEKDKEQAALAREGHITDRYVKAVTLLDSDGMTARMAGIYALDRIMRDSEKDHVTIVQLLAGFVRQWAAMDGDWDAWLPNELLPPEHSKLKDDVQAALTVLGKRPQRPEDFEIDLRRTYLRGAHLAGARLEGAAFTMSDLTGADFTGAHLAEANFYRARVSAVVASGADLSRAHMEEARVSGDFTGAKLESANLRAAHLALADLRHATFDDANLAYAKFVDVDPADRQHRIALVEAHQLLAATIISGTQLPNHLASDPALIKHIAECDERWTA